MVTTLCCRTQHYGPRTELPPAPFVFCMDWWVLLNQGEKEQACLGPQLLLEHGLYYWTGSKKVLC